MANRNLPTYYLVEADMLPEIFLKVMEAKELLQTGECSTVGGAERVRPVRREYPHDQSEHSGERLRHDHHQRRDRRNEREHGNAHEPPRRRRRGYPRRDFSGIRPI